MLYKDVSDSSLKEAIKSLSKTWGSGLDTRGLADASYKAIPTGHDDLDSVLTRGSRGLYLGGICEISGPEGSGKSSVAMRAVGCAQKMGLHCMWLDAEGSFSPDLAILNRCDPTKLIMPDLENTKVRSDSDQIHFLNVAQVLELIYQSIVKEVFSIIVLDSVAALIPDRVLSMQNMSDANSMGMAEVARSLSSFLGKISQACKKTETTLIAINQLRDKPGDMWVKDETPGGRALKFFASQRLRIEKVNGKAGQIVHKTDDNKEEVIGHYARCKIIKNKRNKPIMHPIEIGIYYTEYFPDNAKRCYDLARDLQVVKIRQGTLSWKDDNGEVIVEQDGESLFLDFVRTNKLEPRLAHDCCMAALSDKNQQKENPTSVSNSIRDLADAYNSSLKTSITDKSEPKKKTKSHNKKSHVGIDLDDKS